MLNVAMGIPIQTRRLNGMIRCGRWKGGLGCSSALLRAQRIERKQVCSVVGKIIKKKLEREKKKKKKREFQALQNKQLDLRSEKLVMSVSR